ncbi:class I SAM-dependent methyltransferase [Sinomicrobium weinanense]|uniref:Class I SAM-dependent methyltransferase n=1 Tax=Sinomicrobium weinanense TaxID=2842200 RepID=A0A926JQL0_9FLAO|nr:class I SAM-dependent methyltransferase [Sinomicrobium weinanense]MBC9795559.1 class I SAM-dependent methyltransferase [Sinomicrobium weinanense]MBU3124580.1 class I SAM-dependent methyltransferase [Sinomicrobium weinanense]
MKNIYDPKFVEGLFDNMSSSYSRMNYITSFGFSERWRRQCVAEISIQKGKTVVDLMCGMGECWKHILKSSDEGSKLIGVDFSTEMVRRAEQNKTKFNNSAITIFKENVFGNSIEDQVADFVISGFGLKTFDNKQLKNLAGEIDRILKPDGRFSLIDVSVPKNRLLQWFYMFYLKNIIPVLGKLFLGNPETYKMLGIYTQEFGNSENVYRIFAQSGFEVEYVEYFYGCASGIKGRKIR